MEIGLIERTTKRDLRGAVIIGLIRTGELIRVERTAEGKPDYWERTYMIAWERTDQCGTHRAHVNSDGECALFIGHYDFADPDTAIRDMLDRANIKQGV